MANKTEINLLLFALFGFGMWFFGNLYEGIVITPNLLKHSIEKLYHWQQFFTVTNPVLFYIPLVPFSIAILVILYFKKSKEGFQTKKYLKQSIIFLIPPLLVGIYVVTQINLILFFGDLDQISARVYKLSLLWNILNVVRVIFLALVTYNL